jgi:hypothetical protein
MGRQSLIRGGMLNIHSYYTTRFYTKNGGGEVVGRVTGIQDFMRGYDYIIVRAPLW